MKKIIYVFMVTMLVFTLIACEEDNNEQVKIIDFYYLNDLHGALLENHDEMGMARIGNFLIDEAENNPETTVILGGGDMVQGTLLSNAFYGENTTKIMDEVYFDATVIGNHEFDWGLEKITRYYDETQDSPYDANHPLLGANVFYEGTEDIPSGIDPYYVIERSDLTIGILGTMGEGLESSILASEVEGYYFADPVPIIETYSETLRSDYDADIVIVISHDSGDSLNAPIANFSDNARIDAVFNGHSHRRDTGKINHMPTIISGSSGSHIGHVQLHLREGDVIQSAARNLGPQSDSRLNQPSPHIEDLINEYYEEIIHYYEADLEASNDLDQRSLTEWMSTLMKQATNADFGFQNTGGTRDTFRSKDPVSKARLYDVFPFDNTVVTTYVPGSEVENLMNGNPYYATNIDMDDFDPNETYKIATNDYVFYHPANNTTEGENITYKSLEMFDIAVYAYETMNELGNSFDLSLIDEVPYYDNWHSE